VYGVVAIGTSCVHDVGIMHASHQRFWILGPDAVVIVTRGTDGCYSYLLPSTVWTIPLSSVLDTMARQDRVCNGLDGSLRLTVDTSKLDPSQVPWASVRACSTRRFHLYGIGLSHPKAFVDAVLQQRAAIIDGVTKTTAGMSVMDAKVTHDR
jgi:hypothetical protein